MSPTFPTMEEHKPARATSTYDGKFDNYDSQVLKGYCFLPEPIIYLLIVILVISVVAIIILSICLYKSKREYKKIGRREENEEAMEMENLQ